MTLSGKAKRNELTSKGHAALTKVNCVCVCVCVCVCMYVCMCVCVLVRVCVCTYSQHLIGALCTGLARTIYIRCIYGIFGRKIVKCTLKYGVYTRLWPTLTMQYQ